MDGDAIDDGFHTCKHCQENVLLSPSIYCDSFSGVYKKRFSMKYIARASSEGCELFRLFLERYHEELRGEAPPPDYMEQEKTLMILFGLKGGGPSDVYITSEGWNDLYGWLGGACARHGKCSAQDENKSTDMSSTDDPAANYFPRRAYDLDMASKQNFQLARRWLDHCKQEHSGICSRRTSAVPTRLVDVGLPDGPPCLKIHETVPSEQAHWCALSYCWGGLQRGTTTKANLSQRRFEIVLSELPKSVQDALSVARELGFQYIWIDSLCIVQDDSRDWAKEVGKMAEVYMGASLTIVAASASSAEEGFLHRRRLSDVLVDGYRTQLLKFRYQCFPSEATTRTTEATQSENMTIGWLHVANWRWKNHFDPIEQRAWTLQEFLLSRRLLLYSTGRISWRCFKSNAGENDSKIYPASGYLLPFLDWKDVVHQYSSRTSSRSDDRLTALGAVAYQFGLLQRQRRQQPPPASTAELAKDYLAGLWRDDLVGQLSWSTNYPRPLPQAPWRAPSWSWAAIDSVSDVGWSLDPRLRVLADEVEPVFVENPFGAVRKAVLRVEAPLVRVRYFYWPQMAPNPRSRFKPEGVLVLVRDQGRAADVKGIGGSERFGDAVLDGTEETVRASISPDALDCLPGLILAATNESREQVAELWLARMAEHLYLVLIEVSEGVFRRCGMLGLTTAYKEAEEPKATERAILARATNIAPWRTFDFV